MKSCNRIKSVRIDNRKRLVYVLIKNRGLSLPYVRLTTMPTSKNPIVDIFVDDELGRQGVTYRLKDGIIDSIPLDAFLDFNKDPEYMRKLELYKLTMKAKKYVTNSGISNREISRRMGTSMSQLSRLLDTTNYKKSIDQMMKFLTILGARVTVKVA